MVSCKMEEVDFISKLMYDIYKIPIYFINVKGELVINHSHSEQAKPAISSKKEQFSQAIYQVEKQPFPVILENNFLESFSVISVWSKEEFTGSIVIGPVHFSTLAKESIDGILNDLGIRESRKELEVYFESLPVISKFNFMTLIKSFYYMLYQEKIDVIDIIQKGKVLERGGPDMERPEVHIAQRRQDAMIHANPLTERKIIESIVKGKKDDLIKIFQMDDEGERNGVLSKSSHLRSQKNIAIAGVTIGTRAAIDGGLYPQVAYTLSDLFIQHVEELNDSMEVNKFLMNALLEFAERVERNKGQNYSKPIHICQNYIFTNLYEEITLKKLAELTEMNASYLSALFKKEVGIGISEYIQRAKVDEAKSLMTYTGHSLLDISTSLNFHDQSHFTRVFKKMVGVTPKHYKNGNVE